MLKKALPVAALAFTLPQLIDRRKQKKYLLQRKKTLESSPLSLISKEKSRGDLIDITVRSPIDGFLLSCTLYPQENPKGVVQVIHGIHEHKGRYGHFARHLQSQGYAVLVSDTRGHGRSVDEKYIRGYMGHYPRLRDDQYIITKYLKSLYPQKPIYLFAHSLGSLIARAYLQKYDDEIDKLILCGTAMYYQPVGFALSFLRFVEFYTGISRWRAFDFLRKTSEEDILERLDEEPDYMHGFRISELMTVLELDHALYDFRAYKRKHLSLPILSISGEHDYLVTGGSRGISATMELLSRLGYKDMISVVYTGMHHEILKDPRKKFIYEDIVSFLALEK